MKSLYPMLCVLLILSCSEVRKKEDHQIIEVKKALNSPTIDGKGTENSWNLADWNTLDQNWLGRPFDHEDFNGRYKLTWDQAALYILVEITDDVLFDKTKDPLKLWWNDDCIEVFVDEDNSGGLHQFDYNAFAYHIALDGNVVDLALDKEPRLYNDHVTSQRTTEGNTSTWEIAVKLYNEKYTDDTHNTPVILMPQKKIGFALAYCDNDKSTERENFIGSVFIPGEDKNQGWIDANVFGTLVLKN